MIANSAEYKQYLASREWAVLREQVRARSGNKCERCYVNKQDAVHHLTYERIGHEWLEDLQAICTPCHEFISGKSEFDPKKVGFERLDFSSSMFDSVSSVLCCPNCGEMFTHAKKAYALRGYDEGENGIADGLTVGGESPEWRRSAVAIRFWCETCPLEFEIIFQQHKGATFIQVRKVYCENGV